MPVVINDDFTISYIDDDVPGAAVVPSVVAGSPEGAPQVLPADVAGSNLNVDTSGGASSLTPDCPAVAHLHVVASPSAISTAIDPVEPASAASFESWVTLGFDLEVARVADALTCVGAPLSFLCSTPSPPLTSQEVLACDRPWIGAFTARVTQALASVGAVACGTARDLPSQQAVAPPGAAALSEAGSGPMVPAPGSSLSLVPTDSSVATTAKAVEEAERLKAIELLLAVVPESALAAACCFTDVHEWLRVPEARRRSTLVRHLGSYS